MAKGRPKGSKNKPNIQININNAPKSRTTHTHKHTKASRTPAYGYDSLVPPHPVYYGSTQLAGYQPNENDDKFLPTISENTQQNALGKTDFLKGIIDKIEFNPVFNNNNNPSNANTNNYTSTSQYEKPLVPQTEKDKDTTVNDVLTPIAEGVSNSARTAAEDYLKYK